MLHARPHSPHVKQLLPTAFGSVRLSSQTAYRTAMMHCPIVQSGAFHDTDNLSFQRLELAMAMYAKGQAVTNQHCFRTQDLHAHRLCEVIGCCSGGQCDTSVALKSSCLAWPQLFS